MNRILTACIGTLLLCAMVAGGVGTEEANAQYRRTTPIVEAVQKTEASIVTVIIPKTKYQRQDTVGTGIVIDERGYIVTNHHVVGSKEWVTVRLSNGKSVWGQVVHSFKGYDLAIVRVKGQPKMKAMIFAPTSDLKRGETVIAIGHPYGYRDTVSVGIISALNRSITMPTGEELTGLIQTDASINPGNSGGPLLNINGELIGINAAIRDGAQGIAFAINAGTVKRLLREKLSALKISGVGHGFLYKEKVLAAEGDRQRVQVAAVYQDTPAAQAGLREGDVILSLSDRRVYNGFDIERALWETRPGQKVSLKVQRQSQIVQVSLTLADGNAMRTSAKVDFSRQAQDVKTARVNQEVKNEDNVLAVNGKAPNAIEGRTQVVPAESLPKFQSVPAKRTADQFDTLEQPQLDQAKAGGDKRRFLQAESVFAFVSVHFAATRRN